MTDFMRDQQSLPLKPGVSEDICAIGEKSTDPGPLETA
jgi:hypothetical protein